MKKILFFTLCLTVLMSGKVFADVGDTLSYCGNSTLATRIGVNNSTITVYWGIMLPPSHTSGHDSVLSALLYVVPQDSGTYTLYIYEGGTTAPQTLRYTKSYYLNPTTAGYVNCALDSAVAITANQNLWVIFANTDVAYPAAACAYANDVNSNWLSTNGTSWSHANTSVGLQQDFSWLIKCVTHTSASAAPYVVVSGPTATTVGTQETFTANATTGSTVTWQMQGATPSTATGSTATATWNTPGVYNVIATATNANGSSKDTLTINVFECDEVTSFPYVMGFESTDPIACWTMIDADDDGFGWDAEVFSGSSSAHTGTGCISSASYINSVGAINPDNWLISPQIYLPQDNGFELSWYVAGVDQTYYAEHYGVYISTTGTDTSDFTLLQEYDITTVNWVMKSINLDSYAGQHVYIAFRHFDVTDQYWMKIDDVTITMQQPSNYNVSFVCEGNFAGVVSTEQGGGTSLCGQQVSMSSEHPTMLYITCQKFEFYLGGFYVNGVNHINDLTLDEGDINYVYSLNFQPVESSEIRVVFVGKEMTINVAANPAAGGTVTGGGTYHYMDTVVLEAHPNPGYSFTGWDDGNTHNPRSIVVTATTTYTANFAATGAVDDVTDVTAVELFPNPASNQVSLRLDGVNGLVDIEIVDMSGRVVLSQAASPVSDAVFVLDVSNLSIGSYFIRAKAEGLDVVKRLIKK